MAIATKIDAVTEIRVIEPGKVTLELSIEEAQVLRAMTGNMLGSPEIVDTIWKALRNAQVPGLPSPELAKYASYYGRGC